MEVYIYVHVCRSSMHVVNSYHVGPAVVGSLCRAVHTIERYMPPDVSVGSTACTTMQSRSCTTTLQKPHI